MKMTGADALVSQFLLEGVDHIFGVPGVQLDDAMDALARLGGSIRYVVNRHEQGSAYMADGFARTTGKVGVCMVVPGPGLLNAMAGLATAYATSSQVLCITGQLATHMIGKKRGVLHEVPEQSRLLDSVTKWHAMATKPEQIPGLVREAFAQLRSGRPRPVALELPPDVLAATADIELIDPATAPDGRAAPDPAAIDAAARALSAAERPVFYVGSGVQLAGAAESLVELAEALQAPVVMSRSGLGTIPADHPLALSKLAGSPVAAEADVLLAIGSRGLGINGKPVPVPEGATVIHIDADPDSMAEPRSPAISIVADAALAIDALLARVEPRPKDPARIAALEEQRAIGAGRLESIAPQMSYLSALRAAMPRDAVLVGEVTQLSYAVRIGFPFYVPRSNVTAGYQGTLGFGFPTALGAAMGNPGRAVVSITGDGGFGWGLAELATAKRHDIPLVTVIFNDSAFGNVRRTQRDVYGGRYIGSDLVNPDFIALAESFGIAAQRVNSPAELETAVRDAIAAKRATVIEVPVGEFPDPWHLID